MNASDWDAMYQKPSGLRLWPNEELVRFGGRHDHQLGNVLEVGCGNGANIGYLLTASAYICGLDFSVESLRLAAQQYPPHQRSKTLDLREHDLRVELPVDRMFDTVIDIMTSQHLPWERHRSLYREYVDVLRPGGRVFLVHLDATTSGMRKFPASGFNGIDWIGLELFPQIGFVSLPSREALSAVLLAVGFRNLEQRSFTRTYTDGLKASYAVLEASV